MAKGGLIGHPVAHSRSPVIFKIMRRLLSPALDYGAVDVPPKELERALDRLQSRGWIGAGVTRPHKQAVIPFLDSLTAPAKAAGAVNAISFSKGRRVGHNTDAAGFSDALRRMGVDPAGRDAVIFGAGGAARAAAFALGKLKARGVIFAARTPERARAAAADLSRACPGTAYAAGPARPAALWVNATPLGWKDGEGSPSPAKARCEAAFDMIYGRRTPFLASAEKSGAFISDGLAMLAFQAVRAWEFWFSKSLTAAQRREAAEEILKELEEPALVRAS